MKRTSIARRNLMHDRGRTAVALAGLGFSLVVIFLQLGFLQVMLSTATTVLDKLDYDIMIVSKNYHYLADAGQFPLPRLVRARAVRGVERVLPVYVRFGIWRSQASPERTRPRPKTGDRNRSWCWVSLPRPAPPANSPSSPSGSSIRNRSWSSSLSSPRRGHS